MDEGVLWEGGGTRMMEEKMEKRRVVAVYLCGEGKAKK